jgi:peroxiredoxin Q/BCP
MIAAPLSAGTRAPEFNVTLHDGSTRSLADYAGRKLALYFYPKDNTPGCTAQACNLNEHLTELTSRGIAVLGVSPDSEASHLKFIAKYELGFDLVADTDRSLHEAFGVWGLKKFMGREYDGTHRTTFLIDESGEIVHVILKPKTKDHAAEVLAGFGLA